MTTDPRLGPRSGRCADATHDHDGDEGGPGALLLLLLDSRSPAGAHHHSAGMEAAITTGLVHDLDGVERYCRTRLRTSGRVAADFADAACRLARVSTAVPASGDAVCGDAAGGRAAQAPAPQPHPDWVLLEAEFEARTPSEALRTASRQLGRGLTRLVRSMVPGFDVPTQHHPLVLGAAVAVAGGTPSLAARAAALGTVTLPASAAVRLLGLDPFAVQGMLAGLAREIDSGAFRPPVNHNAPRSLKDPGWAADSAPALDLLADVHLTAEVRLFAS